VLSDPSAPHYGGDRSQHREIEGTPLPDCRVACGRTGTPVRRREPAGRQIDRLLPAALQTGFATAEDQIQQLAAAHPGRLKLITRRTNYMINTWMHNIPALKLSVHETNPLWTDPQNAAKRQLYEGDDVTCAAVPAALRPS
jgi:anaerobic selenocysteine-containing dehydrogenase